MKQFLLILGIIFTASFAGAQSNVYLKINHQLGTAPFQLNMATTNNNGVQFDLNRMQYLISEVTLIHDGGMETMVPNSYFFLDGTIAFNELLGSYAITSLEAVRFGVGVDSLANHSDPSSYPSGHALAPRAPSMHWGWQAGYKFAVLEGLAGQNLDQVFELHPLGDRDYYYTTVNTSGVTNGSDLIIELDGDYTRALEDIDVSTGMIHHGSNQITAQVLTNFRDYVFTASGTHTSSRDQLEEHLIEMSVFPNPAQQTGTITVKADFPTRSIIRVSDLLGRTLSELTPHAGSVEFELPSAGTYLISAYQDNNYIGGKKLVVTQ